MKKCNIIKKSIDFDRIIHSNRSFKYKYFIIYIEWNDSDSYHFGLSVGKKIGNAVMRNRVKRQLKSIIDKKDYKNGFNCIIIVTRDILKYSYNEILSDYDIVLNKLSITEEK